MEAVRYVDVVTAANGRARRSAGLRGSPRSMGVHHAGPPTTTTLSNDQMRTSSPSSIPHQTSSTKPSATANTTVPLDADTAMDYPYIPPSSKSSSSSSQLNEETPHPPSGVSDGAVNCIEMSVPVTSPNCASAAASESAHTTRQRQLPATAGHLATETDPSEESTSGAVSAGKTKTGPVKDLPTSSNHLIPPPSPPPSVSANRSGSDAASSAWNLPGDMSPFSDTAAAPSAGNSDLSPSGNSDVPPSGNSESSQESDSARLRWQHDVKAKQSGFGCRKQDSRNMRFAEIAKLHLCGNRSKKASREVSPPNVNPQSHAHPTSSADTSNGCPTPEASPDTSLPPSLPVKSPDTAHRLLRRVSTSRSLPPLHSRSQQPQHDRRLQLRRYNDQRHNWTVWSARRETRGPRIAVAGSTISSDVSTTVKSHAAISSGGSRIVPAQSSVPFNNGGSEECSIGGACEPSNQCPTAGTKGSAWSSPLVSSPKVESFIDADGNIPSKTNFTFNTAAWQRMNKLAAAAMSGQNGVNSTRLNVIRLLWVVAGMQNIPLRSLIQRLRSETGMTKRAASHPPCRRRRTVWCRRHSRRPETAECIDGEKSKSRTGPANAQIITSQLGDKCLGQDDLRSHLLFRQGVRPQHASGGSPVTTASAVGRLSPHAFQPRSAPAAVPNGCRFSVSEVSAITEPSGDDGSICSADTYVSGVGGMNNNDCLLKVEESGELPLFVPSMQPPFSSVTSAPGDGNVHDSPVASSAFPSVFGKNGLCAEVSPSESDATPQYAPPVSIPPTLPLQSGSQCSRIEALETCASTVAVGGAPFRRKITNLPLKSQTAPTPPADGKADALSCPKAQESVATAAVPAGNMKILGHGSAANLSMHADGSVNNCSTEFQFSRLRAHSFDVGLITGDPTASSAPTLCCNESLNVPSIMFVPPVYAANGQVVGAVHNQVSGIRSFVNCGQMFHVRVPPHLTAGLAAANCINHRSPSGPQHVRSGVYQAKQGDYVKNNEVFYNATTPNPAVPWIPPGTYNSPQPVLLSKQQSPSNANGSPVYCQLLSPNGMSLNIHGPVQPRPPTGGLQNSSTTDAKPGMVEVMSCDNRSISVGGYYADPMAARDQGTVFDACGIPRATTRADDGASWGVHGHHGHHVAIAHPQAGMRKGSWAYHGQYKDWSSHEALDNRGREVRPRNSLGAGMGSLERQRRCDQPSYSRTSTASIDSSKCSTSANSSFASYTAAGVLMSLNDGPQSDPQGGRLHGGIAGLPPGLERRNSFFSDHILDSNYAYGGGQYHHQRRTPFKLYSPLGEPGGSNPKRPPRWWWKVTSSLTSEIQNFEEMVNQHNKDYEDWTYGKCFVDLLKCELGRWLTTDPRCAEYRQGVEPILVQEFGSYLTNLRLPISDVDLALTGLTVGHTSTARDLILSYAGDFLRGESAPLSTVQCDPLLTTLIEKVTLIPATTPILTVETKGSLSGVPHHVDISIADAKHTGVAAAHLIKRYCEVYPKLRPLILVLKKLVSMKKLNKPFEGGITSYALSLMIIAFLQATSLHPSQNDNTLGGLLLNFLAFYGGVNVPSGGHVSASIVRFNTRSKPIVLPCGNRAYTSNRYSYQQMLIDLMPPPTCPESPVPPPSATTTSQSLPVLPQPSNTPSYPIEESSVSPCEGSATVTASLSPERRGTDGYLQPPPIMPSPRYHSDEDARFSPFKLIGSWNKQMRPRLWIVDPLDSRNNVGRSAFKILSLRTAFNSAFNILRSLGSNEERQTRVDVAAGTGGSGGGGSHHYPSMMADASTGSNNAGENSVRNTTFLDSIFSLR